jgi:hypothetical protein|tara:strand:- start:342 stop:572 length:231 start_codon:yes stop_codon:yes gene_type:complete
MKDIIKYIEYGVTIKKTNIGYRVFTIPTQHFNIDSLEELTPDKFEEEIENQKESERLQNALIEIDWNEYLNQNKDE